MRDYSDMPVQGEHRPKLAFGLATVFLIGLFVLALFQSQALVTLAYDLPPNEWSEGVVVLAESWHGLAEASGAASLSAAMSDAIVSWHDVPVAD